MASRSQTPKARRDIAQSHSPRGVLRAWPGGEGQDVGRRVRAAEADVEVPDGVVVGEQDSHPAPVAIAQGRSCSLPDERLGVGEGGGPGPGLDLDLDLVGRDHRDSLAASAS